jgi:hypothetical protein
MDIVITAKINGGVNPTPCEDWKVQYRNKAGRVCYTSMIDGRKTLTELRVHALEFCKNYGMKSADIQRW